MTEVNVKFKESTCYLIAKGIEQLPFSISLRHGRRFRIHDANEKSFQIDLNSLMQKVIVALKKTNCDAEGLIEYRQAFAAVRNKGYLAPYNQLKKKNILTRLITWIKHYFSERQRVKLFEKIDHLIDQKQKQNLVLHEHKPEGIDQEIDALEREMEQLLADKKIPKKVSEEESYNSFFIFPKKKEKVTDSFRDLKLLPDELIMEIMSHLDSVSLSHFSLANKRSEQIAKTIPSFQKLKKEIEFKTFKCWKDLLLSKNCAFSLWDKYLKSISKIMRYYPKQMVKVFKEFLENVNEGNFLKAATVLEYLLNYKLISMDEAFCIIGKIDGKVGQAFLIGLLNQFSFQGFPEILFNLIDFVDTHPSYHDSQKLALKLRLAGCILLQDPEKGLAQLISITEDADPDFIDQQLENLLVSCLTSQAKNSKEAIQKIKQFAVLKNLNHKLESIDSALEFPRQLELTDLLNQCESLDSQKALRIIKKVESIAAQSHTLSSNMKDSILFAYTRAGLWKQILDNQFSFVQINLLGDTLSRRPSDSKVLLPELLKFAKSDLSHFLSMVVDNITKLSQEDATELTTEALNVCKSGVGNQKDLLTIAWIFIHLDIDIAQEILEKTEFHADVEPCRVFLLAKMADKYKKMNQKQKALEVLQEAETAVAQFEETITGFSKDPREIQALALLARTYATLDPDKANTLFETICEKVKISGIDFRSAEEHERKDRYAYRTVIPDLAITALFIKPSALFSIVDCIEEVDRDKMSVYFELVSALENKQPVRLESDMASQIDLQLTFIQNNNLAYSLRF